MDHAPVVDEFDHVSAFLSLPAILQTAALSAVFAAADVPLDQVEPLRDLFGVLAEIEDGPIPEGSRQFLATAGHLFTSLYLARSNGWEK